MVEKATPDNVTVWIEKQSDLSPVEKQELTEDLESYFKQRRKRIESERERLSR